MQIIRLKMVLVGYLEISFHITSMTFKVVEAYEGEHLSTILVDQFKHKAKKHGKCIIKISFSQPDWMNGSEV